MRLLILVLMLIVTSNAYASVNPAIIAEIESSGNPKAYNTRTTATGLYQITPICLRHFNDVHYTNFSMGELFDPKLNTKIASWYLDWLKNRCSTDEEVLISYNFGYGNMRKWKTGKIQLPQETKNYLLKYKKLSGKM